MEPLKNAEVASLVPDFEKVIVTNTRQQTTQLNRDRMGKKSLPNLCLAEVGIGGVSLEDRHRLGTWCSLP
jgi:hypothetical protein